MIQGYCRTNLDEGKRFEWPKVFIDVPRVGERVRAMNAEYTLTVVGITHIAKYDAENQQEKSFIEVELNR